MGNYLQVLEAMHGDMIAGLLGRKMGGAEVSPASPVSPTERRGCVMCGKALRSDNRSGFCSKCQLQGLTAARANAKTCLRCGKKLRGDNASGICSQCRTVGITAEAAIVEPVGKTATRTCRECNEELAATNTTGLCRSCGTRQGWAARLAQRADAKEVQTTPKVDAIAPLEAVQSAPLAVPVEPPSVSTPIRTTRFVEGDMVRIVAARLDHPFARGDVVRVNGIEKQPHATWYRVSAGTGLWHNFPEKELVLAS